MTLVEFARTPMSTDPLPCGRCGGTGRLFTADPSRLGRDDPYTCPECSNSAASYLCGGCGHRDLGPVAELVARMTVHWRSHRA